MVGTMQLHLDEAGDGARVLSLYDGGLAAVPEWVWERTGLESLNLSQNGLTAVSERLGELGRLRMLDLGHNASCRLRWADWRSSSTCTWAQTRCGICLRESCAV
jgi:Leucine-rich repeat (LRR) protein